MSSDLPDNVEQRWVLDGTKAFLMSIAAIVVAILGMYVFTSLANATGSTPAVTATVTPDQAPYVIMKLAGSLLLSMALIVVVMVFHEWCHGLAFRWAGARPRYGVKFVARMMPLIYATAPDKWITKRQYLVVILTPTIAVNVMGLSLMLLPTIWRWLMVLPLAIHLGACVGDWWIACVQLRLPRGTIFEDTPQGFHYRIHARQDAAPPS